MTASLHTTESLARDLQALGVKPGMALIVHSSLKSVGQVLGGSAAVILALEQTIGETGTLIMPTFTEYLCDPAEDENKFPEEQRDFVRQHLPFYYPDLSPTAHMGFIPETFRKQSGVLRSSHPHLSFAAWGRHAEYVIADHSLDYALSERSPIGKLYQLRGSILLLGAPKNSNTSLHLAEYWQTNTFKQAKDWDVLLPIDGERCWTKYHDINNSCDDFAKIFNAFEAETGLVRAGRIGDAPSFLMPQREMVDYALHWMNTYRKCEADIADNASRELIKGN